MKATIITVTHPRNHIEMEACALSIRETCKERLDWIIITEAANKSEVQGIVPFERIEDMSYDARLEKIEVGYCRQNAAKLMAVKLIEHDGMVIFLDDDVTAAEDWSSETFLDDNQRPVVYFEHQPDNPWMFAQMAVFGSRCDRLWQLRLPMVMSVGTLREIAASRFADRAMTLWAGGDTGASEFNIMGEAAMMLDADRETFRNRAASRDHWTIDRGIFHDWQLDRRRLRAAVAAGEV